MKAGSFGDAYLPGRAALKYHLLSGNGGMGRCQHDVEGVDHVHDVQP
jgi:hypothetical protein